MKVLVSAYACEPGKGSEPEAGLQVALAAASAHEVWLLTRENNLAALQKYLADHPLCQRVHLCGMDVPGWSMRNKHRNLAALQLYYDAWQRKAAMAAQSLHRRIGFDLVHHATFASYWSRVGVSTVDKPLVWGPVGGGVEAPCRLLPVLGWRGSLEDGARAATRRALAGFFGARSTAAEAAIVLAQNRETLGRLRTRRGIVLPNAVSAAPAVSSEPGQRCRDVVLSSRLIPWKAGTLAIEALRHVSFPDARLVVCGEGPDKRRMERMAHLVGLSGRVDFRGWIQRDEVLRIVRTAGVMLHPALHDEASFSVAEALALGTPVVCLDHGGPPAVARHWPTSPHRLVQPQAPGRTARDLACAIDHFLAEPPPILREPAMAQPAFRDVLLGAYASALM